MTNPILSPRTGLLWRAVRRMAALLRWRALWRRGMRYDGRAAWQGTVASVSILKATIASDDLARLYDRAMLEGDWRVIGADMFAAIAKYEAEYFSKSAFPRPPTILVYPEGEDEND